MKHLALIILPFLFVTALSGQIRFSDSFYNVQVPYFPTGWTVEGNSENWRTNYTSEAGGDIPEAYFYSNPLFNGYSRLVTPEIDLTGAEVVMLSFKQKLTNYLGDYTIGVATRSQNGEWNEVWSVYVTGDIPPETVSVIIDNDDVGQPDFQFCMFFSGASSQAYKWFFDNITLYTLYGTNACLSSTEMPDILTKDDIFSIKGRMTNFGQDNITGFVVNWQTDEGEIHSEQVSGIDVANGETYDFTTVNAYYVPDATGFYDFKLWLSDINGTEDEYPENNSMEKTVEVANHAVTLLPLFEEFTSCTCVPCAGFNSEILGPLLDANPGKYSLIKYQMNWPGTGDPYYTPEGGVRKNYYGVIGVPTLYVDGDDFEQSVFQYQFDEYYARKTKMSLAVSHHLTGSVMNVKAAVIPYADYSAMTVHIVVVEKITTGNVGNNGEIEFHNVMMKMMPDASGTTSSFTINTPYIIDETTDMAETNVEELDDLEVVVFVQDNNTKNVIQSAVSVESEYLLLPPMNLQAVATGNEAGLTWSSPSSTTPEGYNIYRNGQQINTSAVTGNSFTDVVAGYGIFKYTVTAVYGDAESIPSNTSAVEMLDYTGIEPERSLRAEVYPNPAKDHLIIRTEDGFDAFGIFGLTGKMIYGSNLQGKETNVDTKILKPGLYFIKLTGAGNTGLIKLIIQ